MAEKVVVEVEAKTGKAETNIQDVVDAIKDLGNKISDTSEKSDKSFKSIEKSSKGAEKGISRLAKGFKGVGLALKAAGVGLAIDLFNTLKEVFQQNQKVADLFSTSFEFVSIAFNDFADFVINNTSVITNFFKSIFQDPLQSVQNLGNLIKDNIIERFNSLLETLGYVGEAVVKFFKGDFTGAAESAKQAGKEFVDVLTGVDGSFEKVTETVSNVVEATSKYVKENIKAAQSNVELGKQAEIAAVKQQGIVESFDLQAEKLRQVRDEERNTISERIEANNKLKETLDEQEIAMLKQVELQIASAEAEYNKNQNQENTIRLLELQQEKEAVLAQIAGFRSEQLANDLALNREKLELEQSITDASTERSISEATFNAEQIENEYLRLQALQDVSEQEKALEEKRLTEKINNYKIGTQAFQDAQNELLKFQQENGQKQKQLERDVNKAKQQEVTNALGNIAGIVGQNSKFGKSIAVVQAIRDTYAGANKALAQGGIFGFIGAAAVIAGGLANVKTITSSKEPQAPSFAKGGGGSVSTPSVSTPSLPPAFNVVGASDTNQLADAIGGQSQEPVRAFVVSNDVTTAQSMDRNIVDGASI